MAINMIIVAINTFNIGSTGKIMVNISDIARSNGIEYYISCPSARDNYKKSFDNQIFIGNRVVRNIHMILSRIFGFDGFFSITSTLVYIKKLKKIKPDIIHFHNIHGAYINIPLLMKYIEKNKIKVVWTLHDCWSFTGRCPYFIKSKCNKWVSGCKNCVYPKNEYPYSMIDSSNLCWHIKKSILSNKENITFVTPSNWLAELVKISFFKNNKICVINNGIDLNTFQYSPGTFRDKYKIPKVAKIILGVAFDWSERKGLDVFEKLALRLDDQYRIVLIGTNESIDKKLSSKIITIHRTENQQQLAQIYSESDVFLNPTREDNYPTVNMEAIACGLPVITFKTGGSPEIIDDTCGRVVEVDDIDNLYNQIIEVTNLDREKIRKDCIDKSKDFSAEKRMAEYIDLYNELFAGNITKDGD